MSVAHGALRRNLGTWQVVALSVGLMAPSMGANVDPQVQAMTVGRAVPLATIVATVGVLFVSYGLIRLSQRFHHAGSAYGFVGATLGARPGMGAGWALMGCYTVLCATASSIAGLFVSGLLDSLGIWTAQPGWSSLMFALVVLAAALVIAIVPARRGTQTILGFELATLAFIAVLSVVIVVKLVGHDAPSHQTFTMSVFTLPKGVGASTLALGAVFGFLSFAGFEASASLGEEARSPRKGIPRAILGVAVLGGVFFIVTSAIQVMGFGTSAQGLKAFTGSSSLFGDLATSYLTSWVGDVITIGTIVSALGCTSSCIAGSSRLLFAMSRDGVGPRSLPARVSARYGTPAVASTMVGIVVAVILVAFLAAGSNALSCLTYTGTTGTIIILCVYLALTVGAAKEVFFGATGPRKWELVFPLGAVITLGYVLYRTLDPFPTGPAGWEPIAAFAWMAIGVAIAVVARPVARRVGTRLVEADGLRVHIPSTDDRQPVGDPVPVTAG